MEMVVMIVVLMVSWCSGCYGKLVVDGVIVWL